MNSSVSAAGRPAGVSIIALGRVEYIHLARQVHSILLARSVKRTMPAALPNISFDQAEWRARSIKQSFYDYWLEVEGVPVYRGNYVEDVKTMELGPWARMGGKGAYLALADQQITNGYVVEIPPAGSLNPERHLYEELMFVLSGSGSTQVWNEDGKR